MEFLPTIFADLVQFSEGSVSAKQLGKTCGIRQLFADEQSYQAFQANPGCKWMRLERTT